MRNSVSVYAKVLGSLNIPEESVRNTGNMLSGNQILLEVLTSPAVKNSEKDRIIDRIFEEPVRNFLKVLCENQDMGLYFAIYERFKEIVSARKNVVKATLSYVQEPREEQLEAIKTWLCGNYKATEAELILEEKPELLGGFILTVGDFSYDKSISGTLKALQKELAGR